MLIFQTFVALYEAIRNQAHRDVGERKTKNQILSQVAFVILH